MKSRFPGFNKCFEMMRSSNPQTQEDGFHALVPLAREYLKELIDEFRVESNHGLRCWILELIGHAKSPDAYELLSDELRSDDKESRCWAIWGLKYLNTKEARSLLWQARAFTFPSPEETEAFRSDLDHPFNADLEL